MRAQSRWDGTGILCIESGVFDASRGSQVLGRRLRCARDQQLYCRVTRVTRVIIDGLTATGQMGPAHTADPNIEMRQTVILTKARIFFCEKSHRLVDHFEYNASTMLQSLASNATPNILWVRDTRGLLCPRAKGSKGKVHSDVFVRLCLPL